MEDLSVEQNQINFFTIQDLYDEADKQIPVDCTKVYDPLYFWDNFAEDYYKGHKKIQNIQRNIGWFLHKVATLKCNNALDVGCGFGRIAPFMIDGKAVNEVTGIDISPKMLAYAEEYLKDCPTKDKIKFECMSAKSLKFPNNTFDLVFSNECLMHLPYSKVILAIREMRRVSKKYVVLVERFVYQGEHPQPHVWSHSYNQLMGEAGLTVLEDKLIGNGIIGAIARR